MLYTYMYIAIPSNYNINIVGSVLRHQKTMRMFVYVYNNELLVLGISNKDFTGFIVCCNRVFYKF